MKKSFDIGRLVPVTPGDVMALAADTNTTVHGVCSQPVSVFVQPATGSGRVLFQAFQAGRFEFDLRHVENLMFWFEPSLEGSDVDIAILARAAPTVAEGDPESTFTNMDPRPAINPAVAAVMRELKLMQGEMRSLRMQADKPQKRAPDPDPVVEPVQPASTTSNDAKAMKQPENEAPE